MHRYIYHECHNKFNRQAVTGSRLWSEASLCLVFVVHSSVWHYLGRWLHPALVHWNTVSIIMDMFEVIMPLEVSLIAFIDFLLVMIIVVDLTDGHSQILWRVIYDCFYRLAKHLETTKKAEVLRLFTFSNAGIQPSKLAKLLERLEPNMFDHAELVRAASLFQFHFWPALSLKQKYQFIINLNTLEFAYSWCVKVSYFNCAVIAVFVIYEQIIYLAERNEPYYVMLVVGIETVLYAYMFERSFKVAGMLIVTSLLISSLAKQSLSTLSTKLLKRVSHARRRNDRGGQHCLARVVHYFHREHTSVVQLVLQTNKEALSHGFLLLLVFNLPINVLWINLIYFTSVDWLLKVVLAIWLAVQVSVSGVFFFSSASIVPHLHATRNVYVTLQGLLLTHQPGDPNQCQHLADKLLVAKLHEMINTCRPLGIVIGGLEFTITNTAIFTFLTYYFTYLLYMANFLLSIQIDKKYNNAEETPWYIAPI